MSPLLALVGRSVSVSSYALRLVDSMGFLVVSLTPLAPTILSPPLSQGSLRSAYCLAVGFCICFYQLLYEIFLVTIRIGTNLGT